MPRGRQPNYDTRIGNLLDQLRDAIVAREKAEMDRRVSEQVRALVSTLDSGSGEFTYRRLEQAAKVEKAQAPAKRRGPGKGNPKLRSKLKAYWANLSPEERKARVAKMRAGRKGK